MKRMCIRCKKYLDDETNFENVYCWLCLDKIYAAHNREAKIMRLEKKTLKDEFDEYDRDSDEEELDEYIESMAVIEH